MKLNVEILGFDAVKSLFSKFEHELKPSEVRGILDEAGKNIVKQTKVENEFTGDIGKFFKQDIATYRDNRLSNKNAEYIIVGPRFKQYSIHGKPQKVALIAQHMALGFNQTERRTSTGAKRGKVRDQKINPVLSAFEHTKEETNDAINRGIIKKLRKLKIEHPSLVK